MLAVKTALYTMYLKFGPCINGFLKFWYTIYIYYVHCANGAKRHLVKSWSSYTVFRRGRATDMKVELAQMIERLLNVQDVAGSMPAFSKVGCFDLGAF